MNAHAKVLEPPSLALTLKAAATESAFQCSCDTSSSVDVDTAAVCVALDVCEKTAALLRAQLAESEYSASSADVPFQASPRVRSSWWAARWHDFTHSRIGLC